MTSEELAKEIMNAVLATQGRILGVGKEQYSEGNKQQFELMSIQEIIDYAMEEAEDGIAYNVMLRYKLRRLKGAVDEAFAGYTVNRAKHAKAAQPAPVAPSTAPPPLTPPAVQPAAQPANIFQPAPQPSADNLGGGY